MLHIERMRMQLPAGFEHRASSIGRLVADEMAGFEPSEARTVNRLSIKPVQVSPNATDQEIARDIVRQVVSRLRGRV